MRLFKKHEKENLSHLVFLDLTKKWDAFLQKNKLQFNTILINYKQELLNNITNSTYTNNFIYSKLQEKIKRLQNFEQEINRTFKNLFKQKMLKYESVNTVQKEANKAFFLTEEILEKIKRLEFIIKGEIAINFYKNTSISKLDTTELKFSHISKDQLCFDFDSKKQNKTTIYWMIDSIAKYKTIKEWGLLQKVKKLPKNNQRTIFFKK